MKSFSSETKHITSEVTDVLTSVEDPCSLIVWNDDVNTFEWVIETLIEVCWSYGRTSRTMCLPGSF